MVSLSNMSWETTNVVMHITADPVSSTAVKQFMSELRSDPAVLPEQVRAYVAFCNITDVPTEDLFDQPQGIKAKVDWQQVAVYLKEFYNVSN